MQVREMTKMSLCVALCCVTSYIAFPLPFTPAMVTALTLALSVTAYILQPKQTFIVIMVYLLLGIAGLPVFTGGTSGIGTIIGPVGGFKIAWLFAFPALSALKGSKINFKRYAIVNILVAVPITYIGGIISMLLAMDITLMQALTMAVLPFIPGDIMKAIMASILGVKLNSVLSR